MAGRINWINIDLDGLAMVAKRRGLSFVLLELLQNCYDETGCTNVDVVLDPMHNTRNRATLTITDDGEHGFRKLSDAWTMFAPSYKAGNAEQAGRFNMGCKLVLSLCESALIESTTGSVRFSDQGRKKLRRRTERGSKVTLLLRVNQKEIEQIEQAVALVLPRVTTTFGMVDRTGKNVTDIKVLPSPDPLRSIEASLPSEFADDEGQLRRTTRKTTVDIHKPLTDEGGWIYELGLPVVPTGDKYSLNVWQAVPLDMERVNVTPTFLRKLRAATANAAHDLITENDASDSWAREAAASPEIEPDAYEAILDKRFGENRVMFDPSDPEANSRAQANGWTVVHPRQMSKGERNNRKEIERTTGRQMVRPAGQVFPTHSKNTAEVHTVYPLTPGMERVRKLTQKIAAVVLGKPMTVEVVKSRASASAWYSSGVVTYNLQRLGHRFFDDSSTDGLTRVVDLAVHELAHDIESNHLSERYYRACTKLGAKLVVATATQRFQPFTEMYGYKRGGGQ